MIYSNFCCVSIKMSLICKCGKTYLYPASFNKCIFSCQFSISKTVLNDVVVLIPTDSMPSYSGPPVTDSTNVDVNTTLDVAQISRIRYDCSLCSKTYVYKKNLFDSYFKVPYYSTIGL